MAGVQIMSTQALLSASGGGGGGGGGSGVSISDHTIGKIGNGTATISVYIVYGSDGTTRNQNNAILETWLVTGAVSDYEIRATQQAGSSPVGTFNTWLALPQTWSLSVAAGAEDSATFLIEIRDATSHVVLDSATITLNGTNTG